MGLSPRPRPVLPARVLPVACVRVFTLCFACCVCACCVWWSGISARCTQGNLHLSRHHKFNTILFEEIELACHDCEQAASAPCHDNRCRQRAWRLAAQREAATNSHP